MMYWYVSKRWRRRPGAAVAAIAVAAGLMLLLNVLQGIAATQAEDLDAIYRDFEIRCTVSDRQGNTDSLRISPDYIQLFTDPGHELHPYVKDPVIRQSMPYGYDYSATVVGVNRLEAEPALQPVNGTTIIYAEGYSELSFETDENIVWVHQDRLKALDAALGDSIPISFLTLEWEFIIAGYFTGETTTTLYMPWATVHELGKELWIGLPLDSLSFTIADNRRLEEFKNAAAQHFESVNIYAPPSTSGLSALTIHDSLFKNSLYSTQRNIGTLRVLHIVFYILSVLIGFLTCFIFIRARKREFFLFRCLGTPVAKILAIALPEQLLLAALGIAVSAAGWYWWAAALYAWPAVLLLGCFMLGVTASVLHILRAGLLGYKEE